MLTPFLEHLVSEGSVDANVHNALGMILIDSNSNPEHFLTTNEHYDSKVVGKYCEKRDPNLACVAYKRGKCDIELVEVTNKNSLFKMQSRYVVERMDVDLWAHVLADDNPHRRNLIDQVVSTALPESKNPEQVSVTVKAFMTAEMPQELIELLEKIVLQNSAFNNNPNLQNLLILTAIKADKTRVMDYINRLDAFNGPEVGEIAVGNELYEEAFAIFKKFDLHLDAMKVLLECLESIERGSEYASGGPPGGVEPARQGAARGGRRERRRRRVHQSRRLLRPRRRHRRRQAPRRLRGARVVSGDGAQEGEGRQGGHRALLRVRRIDKLSDLEEFIATPNAANRAVVGDRCFDEGLYEAAKVMFISDSNWGRLASTLVKLHQFQAAVDAARKANSAKTWKEICFACVDEGEFRLAQLCGLNIIVQADELEEISEYYQIRGRFDELLALMEAGVGLERAHGHLHRAGHPVRQAPPGEAHGAPQAVQHSHQHPAAHPRVRGDGGVEGALVPVRGVRRVRQRRGRDDGTPRRLGARLVQGCLREGGQRRDLLQRAFVLPRGAPHAAGGFARRAHAARGPPRAWWT